MFFFYYFKIWISSSWSSYFFLRVKKKLEFLSERNSKKFKICQCVSLSNFSDNLYLRNWNTKTVYPLCKFTASSLNTPSKLKVNSVRFSLKTFCLWINTLLKVHPISFYLFIYFYNRKMACLLMREIIRLFWEVKARIL